MKDRAAKTSFLSVHESLQAGHNFPTFIYDFGLPDIFLRMDFYTVGGITQNLLQVLELKI